MEYTQWDWARRTCCRIQWCLNPCCNGIYSMSQLLCVSWIFTRLNPCCNGIYSMRRTSSVKEVLSLCLNPCCNGIYSMSTPQKGLRINDIVLILVVMEYTQWVVVIIVDMNQQIVLILVVMEYTQWAFRDLFLLRLLCRS